MDNHTLRRLVGPIMGYDYVDKRFADDESLVSHQVDLLMKGAETRRFHTVRTITDNTVAEHSWGVAALVWVLTRGQCSAAMMMAALTHDIAEHFVGDVPSPTKRALQISASLSAIEDTVLATAEFVFELTAEEQRLLKLADCLDGMLFCVRERQLGNTGIRKVYGRFESYVKELSPTGFEYTVLSTIQRAWHRANQ